MKKISWIVIVIFSLLIPTLIVSIHPVAMMDSITNDSTSINEYGNQPFLITEWCQNSTTLLDRTTSFEIPHPSSDFTLNSAFLNFSDVRGFRGIRTIEDGATQTYPAGFFSTYKQLAMSFNITKTTKVFGIYWRIWVGLTTNLSNYKVQIRNASGGEPASGYLVQRDLATDLRQSGHWTWENFSTPVVLSPDQYYVVLDGTGIATADDYVAWSFDDNDGTDDGRLFEGNSNVWTEQSSNEDFTLIFDQIVLDTYSPSEVGMEVTIGGKTESVNDVGVGSGNATFSDLGTVGNSSSAFVFSQTSIHYNVSYDAQFSRTSGVNATYAVSNGTAVAWEVNFTRTKVYANYSITIDLPASWYGVTVLRNGTDITGLCSIGDQLYIPEGAIFAGVNAFSIAATSPNLMVGLTTTQPVYIRSETLSATATTLGTGTCNFSIYNPAGTMIKSEIRPIVSGQGTFTYTLALTDALGRWNLTVAMSNDTDSGFISRNFNVTFIPRTLTVTTKDARGALLQTSLQLYRNDSQLIESADTDANGYYQFTGLQAGREYWVEVYELGTPALIANETVALSGDSSRIIFTNYTIWFNYTLSLTVYDQLGELLGVDLEIRNATAATVVSEPISGFGTYDLLEGNYTVVGWVDAVLVANESVQLNKHTAREVYANYLLNKSLVLSLYDMEGDEPLTPRIVIRNGSSDIVINGTFSSTPSFTLPKGNYSLAFFYLGENVGVGGIELLTNAFQTYYLNYSIPHTLAIQTIDARYGEGIQAWINLTNSTGDALYEGYTDPVGQYQISLPADNYTIECYYPSIANLVANVTFNLLRDNFTTIICDYNLTKYYDLSLSVYDAFGEILTVDLIVRNTTGTVINESVTGFATYNLPAENYTVEARIGGSLVNVSGINLASSTGITIYCAYTLNKSLTFSLSDREGDEPLSPRIVVQNATANVIVNGTYSSTPSFTLPKGNYTIVFYYASQLVGNISINLLLDTFQSYNLNYSTPHTLSVRTVDARYGESLQTTVWIYNSTVLIGNVTTGANGEYQWDLPADNYTVEVYYPALVANVSFNLLRDNYTVVVCDYNLTKYYSLIFSITDALGEPLAVNLTLANSTGTVRTELVNGFASYTLPAENYTAELRVGLTLVNTTFVLLTEHTSIDVSCNYVKNKSITIETRDREGDEPLACQVVIRNATAVVVNATFPSIFTVSLPKGNYSIAFYYGVLLVGNETIELLIDELLTYHLNYSIPHSYVLSLSVYDQMGEPLGVNATLWNSTDLVSVTTINGFVALELPEENYTLELRVGGVVVNTSLFTLTQHGILAVYCDYIIEKFFTLQTYDREGDEPLTPRIVVRNVSAGVVANGTFSSVSLPKGNYTLTFHYAARVVGVVAVTLLTDTFRTYALNYSTPHTLSVQTVDRLHGDVLRVNVTLTNSTQGVLTANATIPVSGYMSWDLPADNYTLVGWYGSQVVLNVTFNLLFHNTTVLVCAYDLIYTYDLTIRVTDADGGDFLVSNITVTNATLDTVASGLTDGYGVRTFPLAEGNYSVVVRYQGAPVAQFPVALTADNDTLVYANVTVPHYYFLILNSLDAERNDILYPAVEVRNATALIANKTADAFGRVSFTLLEGGYHATFRIDGALVGNLSYLIQGASIEDTVQLNYSVAKLVAIHTTDRDQENVPTTVKVYNATGGLVADVTTDAGGYYDLYLPDGNYTVDVYYGGALEYTGALNVTGQTTLPIQMGGVDVNPQTGGIDPILLVALISVVGALGGATGYLGVLRPRRVRERNRLLALKKHYTEVWSIQHALGIYRASGACVTSVTYGATLDRDLLGGFLNAIQSFGLEMSQEKAKGLRTLAYHGMHIVMSRGGKHLDLVLVMDEEPSANLVERLDMLVAAYEDSHAEDLEVFSGNVDPFRDFEQFLRHYLEIDLKFLHGLDRARFPKAPPYTCRKSIHRMFKLEKRVPLRLVVRQILLEATGTDPKVYDEVDTLRRKGILAVARETDAGEQSTLWGALARKGGADR